MEQKEQTIQWHPAFFAGIQIELGDEAKYFSFEAEHQLGTKPMAIDVLVKKEKERRIRKNIGRIFRTHNVIEYKSPTDYLSVDDFYKVYGYACFYKSDVATVDSISIEDLTITFVSTNYPRKLIRHLREVKKYQIHKSEKGIYYVYGDQIPIQILVASQLDPSENLWLRSLTNNLHERQMARKLIDEYQKHGKNVLYQSMMDVIVRANTQQFNREDKKMCEALRELMEEEFEAERGKARREGRTEGLKEGRAEGLKAGMKEGRMEAVKTVVSNLLEMNMPIEEIVKVTGESEEIVEKMIEELRG